MCELNSSCSLFFVTRTYNVKNNEFVQRVITLNSHTEEIHTHMIIITMIMNGISVFFLSLRYFISYVYNHRHICLDMNEKTPNQHRLIDRNADGEGSWLRLVVLGIEGMTKMRKLHLRSIFHTSWSRPIDRIVVLGYQVRIPRRKQSKISLSSLTCDNLHKHNIIDVVRRSVGIDH